MPSVVNGDPGHLMAEQPDREEQYLLRVQDKVLANKLRKVLRQLGADPQPPTIELRFSSQSGGDTEARTGQLNVGGEVYPVKRQDLPTVVECFKTFDKVNLVKSGDIGQVIVVSDRDASLPEGTEARNGVTPPMKDARKRRFRNSRDVDPAFMRQVEDAVAIIASGAVPDGYEFVDEEEEYIVSEDGKRGSWQPFQPGRVAQTPEPQAKKSAKRQSKKKGESAEPGVSTENGTHSRAVTPQPAPSQSQANSLDVEDI